MWRKRQDGRQPPASAGPPAPVGLGSIMTNFSVSSGMPGELGGSSVRIGQAPIRRASSQARSRARVNRLAGDFVIAGMEAAETAGAA